jgi:hypothetical protein
LVKNRLAGLEKSGMLTPDREKVGVIIREEAGF